MSQPTLVITGSPVWADTLEKQFSADYTFKRYPERASGYVARLVDDHAALILVDGDGADWRFWCATPKASPAARRIPVVLVSSDAAVRRHALINGADLTLRPDDLPGQLAQLMRDYGRIPDPAMLEQLDCECQEALPPLGSQGIARFNAGEYYAQHDLFEEQWRQTSTPARNLYQAILQIGIAYFQITRGNHRGALKMLLRSVQWLSLLPDTCQGVDVKQLRADSYRVRAALEAMNPADIAHFDRSLLKPIIWKSSGQ